MLFNPCLLLHRSQSILCQLRDNQLVDRKSRHGLHSEIRKCASEKASVFFVSVSVTFDPIALHLTYATRPGGPALLV